MASTVANATEQMQFLFGLILIEIGTCSYWLVRNPLPMQETWVRSLGREDPLEKELGTHSSIHAWKSPWTKEPGGLQFMGSQRVRHD